MRLTGPLKFWDGFITFPLVLVAQGWWCLNGLPAHVGGGSERNEEGNDKFTELKEKR